MALAQTVRLIHSITRSLGDRYLLFSDIQSFLLVLNTNLLMSSCMVCSSCSGQLIMLIRQHSCDIRKVLLIIRFPTLDRFSFLHMAILVLIFFFLASKLSDSFLSLLSILTPRSLKCQHNSFLLYWLVRPDSPAKLSNMLFIISRFFSVSSMSSAKHWRQGMSREPPSSFLCVG